MRVVDMETHVTSPPDDSIHLTPQGQQLLNLLRETGDWTNRSGLARLAGKSALNKWDVVLLNRLAKSGLIEMRQIPRHGPIGYEWQYRAVHDDGDVEQSR